MFYSTSINFGVLFFIATFVAVKNMRYMDFKEKLTIISDDLNHGLIDEDEARDLLMDLLETEEIRCICGWVGSERELVADYYDGYNMSNPVDGCCPKCGRTF